jgi:hypothetical protein
MALWAPGVPILNDDEGKDDVAHAMADIVYNDDANSNNDFDYHQDADDNEDKDSNKEDNYDGDKDPGPTPPTITDNDVADNKTHDPPQETDDNSGINPETEERLEGQRPRRSNTGQGVNRIVMSFDGKMYDKNIQFTTIGEPQNT